MSFTHFKALIKKNLLISKRTYILTLIEVLSPIIIMILFWRLTALFKTENLNIQNDDLYLKTNGTYLRNGYDFSIFEKDFYRNVPISYCPMNSIIALIGKDFPNKLISKIKGIFWDFFRDLSIQYYDSLDEIKDYISSDNYKTDNKSIPEICFGISYLKEGSKYTFKIHYFASPYSRIYPSIPSTTVENVDPFRTQPDFPSFKKYIDEGFLANQKIIYDYILKEDNFYSNAEINMRIIAQKYDTYLYNSFYNFLSMIFGFFVLIGYSLPLTINIFKLVKEKESRAKEGMKIMGLNELNYFFSYFIIYFIMNVVFAICNTFIIKQVMIYIEEIYLFIFFFSLWFINISIA